MDANEAQFKDAVALQFAHDENRRLRRALRRNRWYWRALAGVTVLTAVGIAAHSGNKTENEDEQ